MEKEKMVDVEKIIRDAVDYDDLADYLCADWGHKIAVYADGSVDVGESVGQEIAEEERPIAWVRCPGIDQLEVSQYTDGWTEFNGKTGLYFTEDGRLLSFEECIRECCDYGDESAGLEDLVLALIQDEWNETVRAEGLADRAEALEGKETVFRGPKPLI